MAKSCNGCTDRWVDTEKGVTCHATCQHYKEQQKEHEERRKREKEDKVYTTPAKAKKVNKQRLWHK